MQLNQVSGKGSRLTDAVTARAGARCGTPAAAKDDNWVWDGVDVIDPEHTRALVGLSRGSADATREYEMAPWRFVDGVSLPEAKSRAGDCGRETGVSVVRSILPAFKTKRMNNVEKG
jgi:prolyl oligopeptidase PreP (S9A serine peptidase family)